MLARISKTTLRHLCLRDIRSRRIKIAVFFNVVTLSCYCLFSPWLSAQDDARIKKYVTPFTELIYRNASLFNSTRLKPTPTKQCSDRSPLLFGDLNLNISAVPDNVSFGVIAEANPDLELGGMHNPTHCIAVLPRLAIIIPYRNRETSLRTLLNHLHPFLQRQQLDYTIFVVEQANNETFNKAFLMNVAFTESRRLGALEISRSTNRSRNYECYIFHDVDLFIENDFGIYKCGPNPIHLSEYIDKFGYESYGGADILYGGVVSIRPELFERVNGYSNIFFGWGGEDEEMRRRLKITNIPIDKPDKALYRYQMKKHGRDPTNPWNNVVYKMLGQTEIRMQIDGLSSLKWIKYKLVSTELLPTHTLLKIDFSRQDIYKGVFGDPKQQSFVTSGVR